MRYVLGFDGGGTKTDCVLMDEVGGILARSRSGSSNPTTFGVDASVAALLEAAAGALGAASRSDEHVAYIVAGISGAGEPTIRLAVQSGLQPRFPKAAIVVTSDLVLSLGATGESPSVAVIAGTGSAVLGKSPQSGFARAGGFGPVIGDPGSAYDIGKRAVAMCFQKHLNSEVFPLGAAILESFQGKFNKLFDQVQAEPGAVFARIFPVVAGAAESGDADARALLTSAARDLRDQAREVIDRLKLRESDFFLAKTGGVFDGSAFLNGQFDGLIREIAPQARIGPLPRSVAEAAAQLASDALKNRIVLDES
ncbi:MAG TPA: BadF/BadG/BcrA/BcrD ATPase family protein [Candidatus Acidoferrum sp.]|nr:BadF/BadG/BcrA/BcrD ATPase family protein [Candidatus Acidoferrum sp.]